MNFMRTLLESIVGKRTIISKKGDTFLILGMCVAFIIIFPLVNTLTTIETWLLIPLLLIPAFLIWFTVFCIQYTNNKL